MTTYTVNVQEIVTTSHIVEVEAEDSDHAATLAAGLLSGRLTPAARVTTIHSPGIAVKAFVKHTNQWGITHWLEADV